MNNTNIYIFSSCCYCYRVSQVVYDNPTDGDILRRPPCSLVIVQLFAVFSFVLPFFTGAYHWLQNTAEICHVFDLSLIIYSEW